MMRYGLNIYHSHREKLVAQTHEQTAITRGGRERTGRSLPIFSSSFPYQLLMRSWKKFGDYQQVISYENCTIHYEDLSPERIGSPKVRTTGKFVMRLHGARWTDERL
jgi:hypothetical protein